MLISTVAIRQDNSAHGEDNYLARALDGHASMDAVMDGVTRRGGRQATRLLLDALALTPLMSAGDTVAVLERVNYQLYQTGGGRFLLTTVSTALCLDGKLSIVGVGDSSAFVIRSDTFQHLYSPMHGVFLGAREQLLGLYRAEVTIEPGDRLVLATDGVTDNITSDELVEIVRRTASPDEAAEQISTIMARHSAEERPPTPLRRRFRDDDWTVIVRLFGAASEKSPPSSPAGQTRKV